MPLYMDLHHIDPDLSQDDLDQAHVKDIRIQDKYGLNHKKYYVNFEANTVFCLIQAPNKKALHDAHAEVHGVGPCNVIEVTSLTPSFDFHTMIGDQGGKNEFDVALTRSGEIDTGFRTILQVFVKPLSPSGLDPERDLMRFIEKYDGSVVEMPDDQILASFLHVDEAVLCTYSLQSYLSAKRSDLEFTIALVTGRPVDDSGKVLFEEVHRQLGILCGMGSSGKAYVDAATLAIFKRNMSECETFDTEHFETVSKSDMHFLGELWEVLEKRLVNPAFRAGDLERELGMSKSQLYRRITSLLDTSPGSLLQEVRLRRALTMLLSPDHTISEVAYELGFNSPNYFTRLFKKRFGTSPSAYSSLQV